MLVRVYSLHAVVVVAQVLQAVGIEAGHKRGVSGGQSEQQQEKKKGKTHATCIIDTNTGPKNARQVRLY